MLSFTPGTLTAAQAKELNNLLRFKEAFSRLYAAPPLNITKVGGVPCVSASLPEFVTTLDYVESRADIASNLTPDDTWVDLGYDITLPAAGTYEVTASWAAAGEISATPAGRIWGRVWNETTGAADIAGMALVKLLEIPVIGLSGFSNVTTVERIFFIAAPTTLHLEAMRASGPTWTSAFIPGAVNSSCCTRLAYKRLS